MRSCALKPAAALAPRSHCLQGSSSMEEVKRAHKTEISELVRTSNAKYIATIRISHRSSK